MSVVLDRLSAAASVPVFHVPRLASSAALLLLVCAAVTAADAATAAPLELMEAVALAERAAPMIAARQAAVEAAQQLVVPAGERPDPQIMFGIDNLPVTGADALDWNRDFMTMRKVGLVQSLPRRAKRELRSQRAAADAARERALLLAEQLGTRETVAAAWIASALAERKLELVTALRPRAEALVAAATASISSGRGTGADAIAAHQARLQLEDRIDQTQLERDQAQRALVQWLPDAQGRPLGTAPDFSELGNRGQRADWTSRIAHHRELLAFDAIAAAASAEIALARAEKRPDWSVELAYADRGPMFSGMLSLQFRVDLPLFAARRQDPTIAAREALLLQVESERAAALRMHATELERMHATWLSSAQRLRRYEQELLPLGDDRANAALAAYRGGGADLQSVLTALDAALEQRIAYVDLQNRLGQSWAALRFAFAEEAPR